MIHTILASLVCLVSSKTYLRIGITLKSFWLRAGVGVGVLLWIGLPEDLKIIEDSELCCSLLGDGQQASDATGYSDYR